MNVQTAGPWEIQPSDWVEEYACYLEKSTRFPFREISYSRRFPAKAILGNIIDFFGRESAHIADWCA